MKATQTSRCFYDLHSAPPARTSGQVGICPRTARPRPTPRGHRPTGRGDTQRRQVLSHPSQSRHDTGALTDEVWAISQELSEPDCDYVLDYLVAEAEEHLPCREN